MSRLASYIERLNHLPIDLRAEVVLADMLEDGVSPDDLIINPLGVFKRATGRDISQVEWIEVSNKSQQWLQIDLNRSGLYDLLPEGVFHQPTTGDVPVSKEAILNEMAVQHQRERAARRFFLPLEQEFFRQRLRIEQEQRAFLTGIDTTRPDVWLGWFWDLPDFLTTDQIKRLLYLLPVIHQVAGDIVAMEACFCQLVDEKVSLKHYPPGKELIRSDSPGLGAWELGTNSVFRGWLYDGEPILRITVQIERTDQLADYLPDGRGQRLIEWLAGYLVPLDVGIRLELDTSLLDNAFLFASDDAFGRLDFTTFM